MGLSARNSNLPNNMSSSGTGTPCYRQASAPNLKAKNVKDTLSKQVECPFKKIWSDFDPNLTTGCNDLLCCLVFLAYTHLTCEKGARMINLIDKPMELNFRELKHG